MQTKILVVEDDRHIALGLKIRLSAAGYVVSLAANVAEALEIVDNLPPDVAVLDNNLPDGNGIDLMKTLIADMSGVPLNCIVMSASRRPGLAERALDCGAVAFLEKPFASADLLKIVARSSDSSLLSLDEP